MTLEYLKGTSVGLRPAVKHLWPFLGQCNKLAIDRLNQSLPEMTAANFKAWCPYSDLETAFLNKKKAPFAWGKHTQTHTKHRLQVDLVAASNSFLLLM